MLKEFNLVVSTYRGRENDCISELWYFLRDLGDRRFEASPTGLPGLIVARTSLNPLDVVEKLREEVLKSPWYFRFILKVVPIAKVVPADLETISSEASKMALEAISPEETYKVIVRKRLSELGTREVIEAVASRIDRKVSLEKPDKVVVVEIIGDVAGIAVLKPDQIVSVQKLKREARRAGWE